MQNFYLDPFTDIDRVFSLKRPEKFFIFFVFLKYLPSFISFVYKSLVCTLFMAKFLKPKIIPRYEFSQRPVAK